MTLAVRNAVIYIGAVIAIILLCAFLFAGYEMVLGPVDPAFQQQWPHTWLSWKFEVEARDVVATLAATGAVGLIASAGLIISWRAFRRLSSAEVYFFSLFLIGLAFEQLRVVQLYLIQLNLPAVYGTLVTRFVIAARIAGGFFLFVASLYAVGVDYSRIGSLTIAVGVASFLFVYFIPVDTVVVDASMLHRVGAQSSLELVMLIVGVLAVANYFFAAARQHRERGLLLALAVTALVIAREVAWFLPTLAWTIAAVSLFAYGVGSFIGVTRANYLWY